MAKIPHAKTYENPNHRGNVTKLERPAPPVFTRPGDLDSAWEIATTSPCLAERRFAQHYFISAAAGEPKLEVREGLWKQAFELIVDESTFVCRSPGVFKHFIQKCPDKNLRAGISEILAKMWRLPSTGQQLKQAA